METSLRKFAVLGGATMEENKASESNGEDESFGEEIVLQVGAGKRASESDDELKSSRKRVMNKEHSSKVTKSSSEYESGSSSSAKREHLGDQLESAKSEINEVMEENQRLKTYLDRIMKDYQTLQMQYRDHVLHQQARTSTSTLPAHNRHDDTEEEPEFVALSLGRTSSGSIKEEIFKIPINGKAGLECKVEEPKTIYNVEPSPVPSPENSIEKMKEDAKETSSPNKSAKNDRDGGDDDISLQNPAKRVRVSVRVRCDTPSMNDGCQWRKYGQKIAKGNPCPRAYYRCTVATSCPVRKQVQRCAEDMSILITTYEGTHNHPLPVAATAMASTTSAAASMIMSGSSTSESGTSTSANINGLNFYLSDNSRPKSIYLSNSSISTSATFPTITLDLTSHSSSTSSSNLSRLSSYPPRYSTTNLNFSSLESNSLPISWSNGILTNYASQQQFNKTQSTTNNTFTFGTPQDTIYQSYLQKSNQQQSLAPDAIAAATKAIATDPSFQSALAAALSSLIGSAAASTSAPGNETINKSSEHFPILSSFASAANNANKCAPSFGNASTSSTNTQPGSLMFLSPSFPFSNSESKSNSPGDNRDHVL